MKNEILLAGLAGWGIGVLYYSLEVIINNKATTQTYILLASVIPALIYVTVVFFIDKKILKCKNDNKSKFKKKS